MKTTAAFSEPNTLPAPIPAESKSAKRLAAAVRDFDNRPDSALVDVCTAGVVANRSRSSIYRHFETGELTIVKVGNSTRIKVGELRRLIGADSPAQAA